MSRAGALSDKAVKIHCPEMFPLNNSNYRLLHPIILNKHQMRGIKPEMRYKNYSTFARFPENDFRNFGNIMAVNNREASSTRAILNYREKFGSEKLPSEGTALSETTSQGSELEQLVANSLNQVAKQLVVQHNAGAGLLDVARDVFGLTPIDRDDHDDDGRFTKPSRPRFTDDDPLHVSGAEARQKAQELGFTSQKFTPEALSYLGVLPQEVAQIIKERVANRDPLLNRLGVDYVHRAVALLYLDADQETLASLEARFQQARQNEADEMFLSKPDL